MQCKRLCQTSGSLQISFHSSPTLARGFFWRTGTMPMRFQNHCVVVANLLQCLELADPVDDALPHRRPFIATTRLHDRVFAMAMSDSLFGKKVIAVGERR